ncbi:hypothetical protein [Methanosarcina mazei]|uniref:Uncharacterized protein n=1 Tax=Methanosarcina mazei TaxID=2209 RepID=A0A4P8QTM1_METMZ|nr:hypothetical protein [Methanosarcina mazei]QCR14821.1 hypothetical protein DKM28_01015 [Methanosarcina mazei]
MSKLNKESCRDLVLTSIPMGWLCKLLGSERVLSLIHIALCCWFYCHVNYSNKKDVQSEKYGKVQISYEKAENFNVDKRLFIRNLYALQQLDLIEVYKEAHNKSPYVSLKNHHKTHLYLNKVTLKWLLPIIQTKNSSGCVRLALAIWYIANLQGRYQDLTLDNKLLKYFNIPLRAYIRNLIKLEEIGSIKCERKSGSKTKITILSDNLPQMGKKVKSTDTKNHGTPDKPKNPKKSFNFEAVRAKVE